MSDEMHMEAAYRHRDLTARQQWHGEAPDEALMAAEEGEETETPKADRQLMMEALRVYLFADGNPDCWQNVAVRGHAVFRHFAPWLLREGREGSELSGLAVAARQRAGYGLEVFAGLCDSENFPEELAKLLGYVFPEGRGWLKKGTRRAYLLAMHYQPALLVKDGEEMTYEDMARIFEGDALATKQQRSAARSRWSARFQELVRKPIERAGGLAAVHKSATARARMAESARGNKNRKRNDQGVPLADEKTL